VSAPSCRARRDHSDTAAESYLAAVTEACGSRALAEPMAAYHHGAGGHRRTARSPAPTPWNSSPPTPSPGRCTHALFVRPVPVRRADPHRLQAIAPMLAALDTVVDVDLAPLAPLYRQAADRAAEVTDHAERQPFVTALYEHFFRTALPRIANQHGIVFTPIEVVDYILRSTGQALRQSHGCGLPANRCRSSTRSPAPGSSPCGSCKAT
jgi:hypothetical protein